MGRVYFDIIGPKETRTQCIIVFRVDNRRCCICGLFSCLRRETRHTSTLVEGLRTEGENELNCPFQTICKLMQKERELIPLIPPIQPLHGEGYRHVGIQVACCLLPGKEPVFGAFGVAPKPLNAFWATSINWATGVLNITATTVNPGKASRYKMWHRRSPRLTLRTFLSPGTSTLTGSEVRPV